MMTTTMDRRGRGRVVAPVQNFLFGHSRAEIVYDCH
jgi:hypothetical protein